MTTSNGSARPPLTNDQLQRVERMVANILSARQEWLSRTIGGDPRRSIADECGYNKNPSVQDYQDYYDSFEIAAKVNDIWPQLTWQIYPSVYETEDTEVELPFEVDWKNLPRQLSSEPSYCEDEDNAAIFNELRELDVKAGIGRYGIGLYGFDDGPDLSRPVAGMQEMNTFPAEKGKKSALYNPSRNNNQTYNFTVNAEFTKGRKLLYFSSFPELLAPIVLWETNRSSPRYGQPVMYRVDMSGCETSNEGNSPPQGTFDVHWTRVLHLADRWHHASSSRILAVPRMRPVWNRLYDLLKVHGADAEAYWRNCVSKMILETNPADGGDVDVDHSSLKDMFERAGTGLQPYYFLRNLVGKTLPPAVVDPTAHIDVQLRSIAMKLDISMRGFMGSERGELASSQDQKKDNKRARGRQTGFATTSIVAPFANRLINAGVLSKPKQVCIWWPEISVMTETEEAQIGLIQTQTDAAYVAGNVESIIPPMDYLTHVRKFTDDEAEEMLDSAEELAVDRVEEDLEQRRAEIDEGLVVDPTKPPPGKPAFGGAPVKNEATATLPQVNVSLTTHNHPGAPPTIQVEGSQPANVVVNVPEQQPANVVVNLPEQAAPAVTVNLPDQQPPTVQFNVPPCPSPTIQVDVAAPNVTVNPPAIVNEVTVNVPEPTIAEVNVTAKLEPVTKVVEIKRTAEGKYEGTVEEK